MTPDKKRKRKSRKKPNDVLEDGKVKRKKLKKGPRVTVQDCGKISDAVTFFSYLTVSHFLEQNTAKVCCKPATIKFTIPEESDGNLKVFAHKARIDFETHKFMKVFLQNFLNFSPVRDSKICFFPNQAICENASRDWALHIKTCSLEHCCKMSRTWVNQVVFFISIQP